MFEEWVFSWVLTIDVAVGISKIETRSRSSEALRELVPMIHQARRSSQVRRWKLKRVYYLDDSDKPESCPLCQRLWWAGQRPRQATFRWWRCRGCRGHFVYTCPNEACRHRVVYPVPAYDCAAIPRRQRH